MQQLSSRWILVALMFTLTCVLAEQLAHAAPGSRRRRADRVIVRPLKEVRAPKGLLLGRGVEGTIPSKVWTCSLKPDRFFLVDLDGDGALTFGGADGLALEGSAFIVPLPSVLLSALGQTSLDTRRGKLVLTPRDVGVQAATLAQAAEFTRIRIRAGLPTVTVSAEASSHCDLHCEYLKLNGLADGHGGLLSHREFADKRGYTDEGAAAGSGSTIAFRHGNYRNALLSWYQSVWHAVPLLDPSLTEIGIGHRYGVCLLYRYETDRRDYDSFCHPAAGATGVPRAFGNRGELPDPTPTIPGRLKGTGCGFPILVRLGSELSGKRLLEATLVDHRGRPVKGVFSDPTRPANPNWTSNSGCAVFLPLCPLASKRQYTARFVFEGQQPLEWSFRTGP